MTVTCSEHRTSLLLLSIRRQLEAEDLNPEERESLQKEADRLEEELDMG